MGGKSEVVGWKEERVGWTSGGRKCLGKRGGEEADVTFFGDVSPRELLVRLEVVVKYLLRVGLHVQLPRRTGHAHLLAVLGNWEEYSDGHVQITQELNVRVGVKLTASHLEACLDHLLRDATLLRRVHVLDDVLHRCRGDEGVQSGHHRLELFVLQPPLVLLVEELDRLADRQLLHLELRLEEEERHVEMGSDDFFTVLVLGQRRFPEVFLELGDVATDFKRVLGVVEIRLHLQGCVGVWMDDSQQPIRAVYKYTM